MSWRSRTTFPTATRSSRPGRAWLACLAAAVLALSLLAGACIHDSASPPPPPAGYEAKVAELDAQGLLRERQRLVEEITFLEERIGELQAVQMAQGPGAAGDAMRAERMNGLRQWRDLAMRKKAHVDSVLRSGAFTRHAVRYKVSHLVRRAERPDGMTGAAAPESPDAPRWEDLPAPDATPDATPGMAVAHRLSHEIVGDTLRVRIDYSGQARARLIEQDDPEAVVVELSPVARTDPPRGSVALGPAAAPRMVEKEQAAPAESARTRTAMRPAPKAAPMAAKGGPPTVLGVSHGPRGKGFEARIRLDRKAAKYRYFTMDNPPRIVLDVYGVRPPSRRNRVIPVGEAQALRIRTGWHAGPGKFRIVVDTSPSYLSAFKVVSDDDGVAVVLP